MQGEYSLLQQLDFQKLNQLYRETSNHLDLLSLKEGIESGSDTSNLLNVALEDVIFLFTKVTGQPCIFVLSGKRFDSAPVGQVLRLRVRLHCFE